VQLFRLLQRHGLLPLYDGRETNASQQRHLVLNALDLELASRWRRTEPASVRTAADLPLHFLRKRALDEPLEPFELGRLLYHLSQRRGYRSNRKKQAGTEVKDGKRESTDSSDVVEAGIKDLLEEIHRVGARTLGEYLASLDPHRDKVRGRWTDRRMYEDEFAAIWTKQASHLGELFSEELRREIRHLLFDQMPIKKQSHLIGNCALEPGERRAAWATLEAQEFQLLRAINELEGFLPGQSSGSPLDAEQRQKIWNLMENSAEVTFKTIRNKLGLSARTTFNLQRKGETKLKGNLTSEHMAAVFAERWRGMSDENKVRVVEDWRTIEQEESLVRRAIGHWKLDEASAQRLAAKSPPGGYCLLSRKAIRKLLPLMKAGMRYKDAEKSIYGERFNGSRVYDRVPPVREALKTLRNPAIERALTELRKVVNALIGEFGTPDEICIELAGDLKKPRPQRAKSHGRSRDRESERDQIRKRIATEFGEGFCPSRADIEKALLYEECGGECPFTGMRYPFSSLFGENSPWQVQHIIPFDRFPDDSFQNKTLCSTRESDNRANCAPFETYSDSQQYEAICNRVRNWKKSNIGKLRRFEIKTSKELESYCSRQLNDNYYATRLACELLGSLYCGRDTPNYEDPREAVFPSSGVITATLRKAWGLEAILRRTTASAYPLNKGTPLADHRHHAIDAIAIALSRPRSIAALTRVDAEDACRPPNVRTAPRLQDPWQDFVASIRPHFERMLVSHRPEHRLSGAIHDETNYGRPHEEDGRQIVHIRKPVPGLSSTDLENIVDPTIREAVRAKAAELGGDLRKWIPDEKAGDWPLLFTRTGKSIPIKRVRIKKTLDVEAIAQGPRIRHVALSNNHHVAVFAALDESGNERRWKSEIVSLYEAMNRNRQNQPVIRSRLPTIPGSVFKFSLMWGDLLLLHKDCDHDKRICEPSYWRVRSIWEQRTLALVRIHDARRMKEIRAAKDWLLLSPDALCKLEAVKVVIDPLGRIRPARD
jgi:CRISPR-associated endonuclease Csn1